MRRARVVPAFVAPALVAATGALALAGCNKCPVPVTYSDAQLKDIQKAVEALPKDSILHQVMRDYEEERDDLRFCR
jgi:hypothetical protein